MGGDPDDRFFDPEEYQVAARMGAFNKKNPIEEFKDFIVTFASVRPSAGTCLAFIRSCVKLTRHGISLSSLEVEQAVEGAFQKLDTLRKMVEMNPFKE